MYPAPEQNYEKDSHEEGLNEDADKVGLEDSDEVVRIIEENGADGQNDDYGLLWNGGRSVDVLDSVEEEDGRQGHDC